MSAGTGKLKTAGGVARRMKESMQRAFSYMQANKDELAIGARSRHLRLPRRGDRSLDNRVEAEIGVGFFVAVFSALRKARRSRHC